MIDPSLTPHHPAVDHDPEGQDAAIRKIVRILQANQGEAKRDHDSRRHIVEALDSYMAAVTELVLVGSLNMDQGNELMEIVRRIVAEET